MQLAAVRFALIILQTSLATAKPPNIVLMVMDDLGWHDLGFRNSGVRTPTIDALQAEGVVLQNYYVMSSCAPTRSTIMTGRHTTRTGIYTPFAGNQPEGVPLAEKFLPQVLKKAGYMTHMVGKWHLGFYKKEYTPTFRGFDTFYGFYGWGEDYFLHQSAYPSPVGRSKMGYDFRWEAEPNCGPGCSVVDRNASGTYSTNLFADRAIDIIDNHNTDKPLFLYLPWQAVHAPRMVPGAYAKPYAKSQRNSDFCGMVAAADEGIGNVTSALKRRNMMDNTVIIFTTDNGGPVNTFDSAGGDAIGASNYPLRGGKHSLFEGGTRGTAFVWARGLMARHHWGFMHSVDWLPTIASLAGADTSGTLPLDGKPQWLHLQHGGSPYETLFLGCQQSPSEAQSRCALRSGPWKLIIGDPGHPCGYSEKFPSGETPIEELYEFDRCNFTDSSLTLYNVTADRGEHHDVATEFPDVVKTMMEELAVWNSSKVPYDHALNRKAPKGEPIKGVWGPWVESESELFFTV